MRRVNRGAWIVGGLVAAVCAGAVAAIAADPARAILEDSGVKGGLVVVVGCDDPALIAGLRANEGYLVQALDTDAAKVAGARKHIQSRGLYGKVSVDTFDGEHLPYVDNLVNLLVLPKEERRLPNEEIERVLAPGGVTVTNQPSTVTLHTWQKPIPPEIDEWTHYLHGADNNAVARDSVVGPPRRYQWISGPVWARSHDHLSSLSAMVSSSGRIFTILDEAPAASVAFDPEWRLVARDAFNGVLLWKREVRPWEGHLRPFRTGPTALAKRLVAVGNRVYVTLGYGKPVSILDAATGQTIGTCEGTVNAMELAVHEGILVAVVGDRPPLALKNTGKMSIELKGTGRTSGSPEKHWRVWRERAPLKHLVAVDAGTGELIWKKNDADTGEIMPTAMAVSGGRVFIQNEKALVGLEAGTGKELWRAARAVNLDSPGSSAPTLVATEGVVICADRETGERAPVADAQGRSAQWHMYPHTAHSRNGEAIAYDAATGKRLWSVTSVENFRAPADVFVMGETAYVRSHKPGFGVGIDLRTGTPQTPPVKKSPIRDPGTHWRCYRNKATERYFVLCQWHTEFYDHTSGSLTRSGFVRGSCQYGQMPCNGLLYAPHHSCACNIESKLNSFNALAPTPNPTENAAGTIRFEKGPAYAPTGNAMSDIQDADWHTYRGDAARGGVANTVVARELEEAWITRLDGRLTAPVVAGGLLLVSTPGNHRVHALDAGSGKPVWRFTAGGAVDSPPTIRDGKAWFGSADGWVYCLRTRDGELAWRRRLAPVDRRIVAYGNVESVWPVHGSVLVQGGVVYAVAGRTTHMDGLFFCALDAATGRELAAKQIEKAAFPDVLSSDGASIFMRQLHLDKHGTVQPRTVPHLFSAAGFLDDSWWHRTYWQYGTGMPGGYTRWFSPGERRPAGRLLVKDGRTVYGFGRRNQYDYMGGHVGLGTAEYLLYAAELPDAQGTAKQVSGTKAKRLRWNQQKPPLPSLWERQIGVLVRGMVLCDELLFVAGPPDLFGKGQQGTGHVYAPVSHKSRHAQREALAGKRGTLLRAVSAKTGETLSETVLSGLPAWDGLIAAHGRLYLTMQDGTVMCYQ
jgi:outer membrane protein assembly factor BamB